MTYSHFLRGVSLAAAVFFLPVSGSAQTFDQFDVPGEDRLLLRGTQAEALERAVQEQKDPVFLYVLPRRTSSTLDRMARELELRFARLTGEGEAVHTGGISFQSYPTNFVERVYIESLRISSDSNYYVGAVSWIPNIYDEDTFREFLETTTFLVGTTRFTGTSDRVGPARISVDEDLVDNLVPRIHNGSLLNMTNMLDDFEASCPGFTLRERAEAILQEELAASGMGDVELEFVRGGGRKWATFNRDSVSVAFLHDAGFTEDNSLVLSFTNQYEATYRLFGSARFEIEVQEDIDFTVGLKMEEGRIWRVNECDASDLRVIDGRRTDDRIGAIVDGGLSINGLPLMRAPEEGGGLFETEEVELIAGPVAGR